MITRKALRWGALVALGLGGACGTDPAPTPAVTARMDFTRPSFFAAPFPSQDLASPTGGFDLSSYPNPHGNLFVQQITALIARDAKGFATTGGTFITFTGDLDPTSLPDLAGSTQPDASVALVGVQPATPDYGRRYPIWVSFNSDAGALAEDHILSLVPLQGIALRPNETYAAIVTSKAHDTTGRAIAPAAELTSLVRGERPKGLSDAAFLQYTSALAVLGSLGQDANELAALAVFTTGDPTAEMLSATDFAVKTPPPKLDVPIAKTDQYDGYCVYQTQISIPDYQQGQEPFTNTGGEWTFDAQGNPIVAQVEPATVIVTVPRAPMPPSGYPMMVMIRTGGGGDRPLVDRGVQAVHNGPPITPGSGPAMEIAKEGYAGASIDGPHGGVRNITHDDEQFLMFNVSNGQALRDNVRESALEIAVFEHLLRTLTFDASDCPGVSPAMVHFDTSKFALMGHSMGATIAPLVLATDPAFKGAVLSGAGASWIENIVYKQDPVPLRPLLEVLLGYSAEHRVLTRGDPVLTLIQWAIEPADPLVYARSLIEEPRSGESPRQILMEQGIVDHYILPPIANGISLSLGLDLAGTELDTTSPELMMQPELTPLASVIQFSNRRAIGFPATANVSPNVTAIVVQHPADGIEDGHEVMFQTAPPKVEYRCFLASLAQGGAARVPDGTVATSCP